MSVAHPALLVRISGQDLPLPSARDPISLTQLALNNQPSVLNVRQAKLSFVISLRRCAVAQNLLIYKIVRSYFLTVFSVRRYFALLGERHTLDSLLEELNAILIHSRVQAKVQPYQASTLDHSSGYLLKLRSEQPTARKV